MNEIIVILCLFGVFYVYFGYPLVLVFLLKVKGVKPVCCEHSQDVKELSAAIIITVHNEKEIIRTKIENTLSLVRDDVTVGDGAAEVIVASDASHDGTDDIVREYASRGVRLVSVTERKGKEFAQAKAVQATNADIIFFTDAKTELDTYALQNGLQYFADPGIGAISSRDEVVGSATSSSGEGAYVRYEMWLRTLESQCGVFGGSLVGLSGSGFAVRKEVAVDLRTDIPSDFALLIAAVKKEFRGVLATDVVCRYAAVPNQKKEFQRKVRTVLRGITTLFRCSEMLNISKYGFFSFQLFSHKLCRWLVPWFLVLGLFCTIVGAFSSVFLNLVLLATIVFGCLALAGAINSQYREKLVCKIPLFFIVTNAGIFWAWMRYFSGARSVYWQPSQR